MISFRDAIALVAAASPHVADVETIETIDRGTSWFFAAGWVGGCGVFVGKADGHLSWCGNEYPRDVYFALHDMGFRDARNGIVVTALHDPEAAVDAIVALNLRYPGESFFPEDERWTHDRVRRHLARLPATFGDQFNDPKFLALGDAGFDFEVVAADTSFWHCEKKLTFDVEGFRALAERPNMVATLGRLRDECVLEVVMTGRLHHVASKERGPNGKVLDLARTRLRRRVPCRVVESHRDYVSLSERPPDVTREVTDLVVDAGVDMLCTGSPGLYATAHCEVLTMPALDEYLAGHA